MDEILKYLDTIAAIDDLERKLTNRKGGSDRGGNAAEIAKLNQAYDAAEAAWAAIAPEFRRGFIRPRRDRWDERRPAKGLPRRRGGRRAGCWESSSRRNLRDACPRVTRPPILFLPLWLPLGPATIRVLGSTRSGFVPRGPKSVLRNSMRRVGWHQVRDLDRAGHKSAVDVVTLVFRRTTLWKKS